jgi:hypothetical protein
MDRHGLGVCCLSKTARLQTTQTWHSSFELLAIAGSGLKTDARAGKLPVALNPEGL